MKSKTALYIAGAVVGIIVLILALLSALAVSFFNAVFSEETSYADGGANISSNVDAGQTLRIISGSENKTLEPLLTKFAQDNGFNVEVSYKGSVDIMLKLQEDDTTDIDAVWPASSIWLSVADNPRVKHEQSVLRSPVVLGVRRSKAKQLGWNGNTLKVESLFEAIKQGNLRFAMTNATQSNSGASGYLGFLYAFAQNPDVLSLKDLAKPKVQNQTRKLLNGIAKTSGSSGWLKDVFLESYNSLDAMINYEAIIIEANQELTESRQEPLQVFYLENGMVVADSPLAYVDNGQDDKEQLFLALQEFLLSDTAKQELLANGRRTGVGLNLQNPDQAVFNPTWGISPEVNIAAVRVPESEVIEEMLNLYQVSLRKPSFTVYVVDVSGSMQGDGLSQLKSAMNTLINQDIAKRYLLQASPKDQHIIIPFNSTPQTVSRFSGNNEEDLNTFSQIVNNLQAGGGTDMYTALEKAFDIINAEESINKYFASVIVMTDGKSENEYKLENLPSGGDVPVFPIMFGEAQPEQLEALAEHTFGRVFDGRGNLIDAFRKAKGYN